MRYFFIELFEIHSGSTLLHLSACLFFNIVLQHVATAILRCSCSPRTLCCVFLQENEIKIGVQDLLRYFGIYVFSDVKALFHCPLFLKRGKMRPLLLRFAKPLLLLKLHHVHIQVSVLLFFIFLQLKFNFHWVSSDSIWNKLLKISWVIPEIKRGP